MDDLSISLTIGGTVLLALELLLLLAVGAGIAMALAMRRRMVRVMRGGTCPCMAMMKGTGNPHD